MASIYPSSRDCNMVRCQCGGCGRETETHWLDTMNFPTCAEPGCDAETCGECGVACECGKVLCADHAVKFDGMALCFECVKEARAEMGMAGAEAAELLKAAV